MTNNIYIYIYFFYENGSSRQPKLAAATTVATVEYLSGTYVPISRRSISLATNYRSDMFRAVFKDDTWSSRAGPFRPNVPTNI
jgi:hypothetical protein